MSNLRQELFKPSRPVIQHEHRFYIHVPPDNAHSDHIRGDVSINLLLKIELKLAFIPIQCIQASISPLLPLKLKRVNYEMLCIQEVTHSFHIYFLSMQATVVG